VILPEAVGPVALDLPGGGHEWAVGVRVYDRGGQLRLEWFGGHHHVCQLTGPPTVDGDRLLLDTREHGQLVIRPVESTDTWMVFDGPTGAMTAWEAYQRGLRRPATGWCVNPRTRPVGTTGRFVSRDDLS